MAWLLDTNTCIYIIKQKPVSVLQKFGSIPPGHVALSVITLAELEYGARKSAAIEKNLSALHLFLIPFDILPFDYNATVEYGISGCNDLFSIASRVHSTRCCILKGVSKGLAVSNTMPGFYRQHQMLQRGWYAFYILR